LKCPAKLDFCGNAQVYNQNDAYYVKANFTELSAHCPISLFN